MSIKKPNFFIVGQTRSGTTSFQDELDQHPDIYFLKPEWPKGKGHFGWVSDYKDDDEYLEQFADVNNERRIGERCNAYLYCPYTAERIKQFSPNAKIIMILRNPIDTMYSLHSSLLYRSTVEHIVDFEEALAAEPMRKKENLESPNKHDPRLLYHEVVKYHTQVKRYFDTFGKENVKVIIFDDYTKNKSTILKETLEFLEMSVDANIEYLNTNPSRKYRNRQIHQIMMENKFGIRGVLRKIPFTDKMYRKINNPPSKREKLNSMLKKKLQDELEPEIIKLSLVLNRDLTFWCKN